MITTKTITQKHIPNMIELSDKVLWKWFVSIEAINKQISLTGGNTIWLFDWNVLIGFWICYKPGLWDRMCVDIDENFAIEWFWYLQTIIILPWLQWKWLWQKILDHIIKNIKKGAWKWILLHAWDGSPNNSSILFFEKNWASAIKTYKDKWYQDSLINWWSCSKCGNPCKCSSVEMKILFNKL